MSKILGTNISAPVVPFDTQDVYPTHVDEYGKGGLMALADVAARDALPVSRLKPGMFVSTVEDGTLWRLKSIDPLEWEAFAGSTVEGAPLDSPHFTGVPTAPTADPGSSTNQVATTAFVHTAISAIAYVHTQDEPSLTWTVNHNLGHKPNVELLTVGGVEFEADVVHTSDNQFVVYLVKETAGFARCI